jgi:hypothetical protein
MEKDVVTQKIKNYAYVRLNTSHVLRSYKVMHKTILKSSATLEHNE